MSPITTPITTPLVSLTVFLPGLRLLMPGVAEPLALTALRDACATFCTKARCWREILDVTLEPRATRISPPYTTLVAIERASIDGRALKPVLFSEVDIDELYAELEGNTPRHIVQVNRSEITVVPFSVGPIRVSVWLAPEAGSRFGVVAGFTEQERQGDVIPEFLFTDYAAAIIAGAAATLAESPTGSHGDVALAPHWRSTFLSAVAGAQVSATIGQQRGRLRTNTTWF